jgi:hypothetical protein
MRSIQECFTAEYELSEMNGNHLDQILETPIYHYHQPSNPLRLKDIYETVFLPNVRKANARTVIVSVVFSSHHATDVKSFKEELQTRFSAELAKRPRLDVTVAEACVRENEREIWLKFKSSRPSKEPDNSWHKRFLSDASHLKCVLAGIVSTKFPCSEDKIHVFFEPDYDYGVAILFRKDKFETVEVPSALKRWSFMARLEPLVDDDYYGKMNSNQASCAAITILQNKSNSKQRMCVVSTHLANKFECPTIQLAQFSALIHDLETHLADIPIVVCGDFNSNRESIVSLYATNQGFPEDLPLPLKKSHGDDTPKTFPGLESWAAWAKQLAHCGKTKENEVLVSTSFSGGKDNRDDFPVEKVWHAPSGLPAAAAAGSCGKLPWRLRRHWEDAKLFRVTSPAR